MVTVRRDPTILLALFVALAAHLLILGMGVRTARHELGWWLQGPAAHAAPATPPLVAVPPPSDPMQQLGDHDTKGTSINNSPGDRPMESTFADPHQEQAAMQRDPAGYGGKGSNRQLDDVLRGNNGSGGQRGANAQAQSPSSVFGSRESALAESTPRVSKPVPVKSNPQVAAGNGEIDPLSQGPNEMRPPSTAPEATAQANASNPQTGSSQGGQSSSPGAGGKPGSADPGAGNPIPTADFESFPVSHIASRLIAGRLEARTGRKMRTRELPRLGPAGLADLSTMENPFVVMILTIDETGNVTDVKIEHSSGSDNVDLPCERAAYTWWFEPLKDPKTGKAGNEEIEFTIYM
jgi:TonB family protein